MKKTTLLTFVLLLCAAVQANPVSVRQAQQAAGSFLLYNESNLIYQQLSLSETFRDDSGEALIYAFDIDNEGYILVSADDEMPAIVGYSLECTFERTLLPPHLLSWIDNYCKDMLAALQDNKKLSGQERKEWRDEWKALLAGDGNYYRRKGGKDVEALLTSKWDQGYGYNNYCPMYGNRHAVTGCVATAMAQIIRYHAYPNVGFGRKSYVHEVYGLQSAVFDTSYYDYTLMPNRVNYYSSDAQQHAVSLLCYHCGVSVSMNYESAQHTTGSGAYSNDVPAALYHFGYTNSYYLSKNGIPSDVWDSLLRNDLDQQRPVYYSGSSSDGGHAFVCDGYRTSSNKYHFNFGWSGSGDGFYSLTSVNGYSSAQGAVFNIVPSNLGPMQDTLYVATDGTGDGSSWASANPNLESAITLKGIYKTGCILVKGGTYYGDTCGSGAAFNLTAGIKIYGGFDGTETAINDRRADATPTILSGQGSRRVMYSPTLTKTTTLNGLHFTEGYADEGAALYATNQVILQSCDFYNNTSASNSLRLTECLFVGGKIYNNQNGGAAIYSNDGNYKNLLIAHNNGDGIAGTGNYLNCDIVCNSNTGVASSQLALRNCVVWHNGQNLPLEGGSQSIIFSAIEGFDVSADTCSNIFLGSSNRQPHGPYFVEPDTTIGISAALGDWRPSHLSPLRDVGDTIKTGVPSTDIDGDNRCEYDFVDIGCYEYGFEGITPNTDISTRLYPNPATHSITIDGLEGDYSIYNIMGQCILQGVTYDTLQVNIDSWPRGLYLLRHKHGTLKIVVTNR